MSDVEIYSCTDTSTAQRLVNTLSDQVIQCINEVCECVSRETKSTATLLSVNLGGENQQKWLKIENPWDTLFGEGHVFVINLPSQSRDKLVVQLLMCSLKTHLKHLMNYIIYTIASNIGSLLEEEG